MIKKCKKSILLIAVIFIAVIGIIVGNSSPIKYFEVDLKYPILNGTDFSYSEATITSDNESRKITSLTVSVDKGYIKSSETEWTITDITTSTKLNHQTATWLFNSGKTPEEVQEILRNIVFSYEENMRINVTVDGNQNSIPEDATITEFTPDAEFDGSEGTTHYYLYVEYPSAPVDGDSNTDWDQAYNDAKNKIFMGMRGYLVTITSEEEDKIIDNISEKGAWAGGARIYNGVSNEYLDGLTSDIFNTTPIINGRTNKDIATSGYNGIGDYNTDFKTTSWKWVCGPEAGLSINIGGSTDETNGLINGNTSGYQNWRRAKEGDWEYESNQEPNNYDKRERWMQVHFPDDSKGWNDLNENTKANEGYLSGYFVEFSDYGGDDNSSTKSSSYINEARTIITETVEHKHNFVYSANNNKISVLCDNDSLATEESCPNHGHEMITRTITASSTSKKYDGEPFSGVSISGEEFSTVDSNAEDTGIIYVGINGTEYGPSDVAPTNVGEYKAYFEVTTKEDTYQAYINITINKKDVEVTPNISGVHYDDVVSNDPLKVNSTVDLTFGSVEFEVDTSYHETGNDPKRDVTIKSITITKDGENVTSNYNVIKNTQKITLEKIPVTLVTEPTATAITYGDTLGDSTVTGEMSCEGTFSFKNESVVPHVKDDSSLEEYEVVFIPTNSEKYEIPTDIMKTSIKVNPKVLEVEWKNTELTYNGESQQPKVEIISGLVGTDSSPLSVSGEKINVGNYTASLSCNSTDYVLNESSKKCAYTINKKDVEVTPNISGVHYDDVVSNDPSKVNSTVDLTFGSVEFEVDTSYHETGNDPKRDVTIKSITITKDGEDVTSNYNVIKNTQKITLEKIPVTLVTEPTATVITYGDTLGDSTVTGEMSCEGTFSFKNESVVPHVKDDSSLEEYEVVFIPTNSEKYEIPTDTMKTSIKVEPKVLEVEWKNTELTYNGESQQPKVEIVSGLVGNDSPTIVVNGSNVNAGEYIAQATCTSDDYKLKALDQVHPYLIKKKDVTIKAINQSVDYGDPISSTVSDVELVTPLVSGDVLKEVTLTADTNTFVANNENDIIVQSVIIKKGENNVTDNYNVTKEKGIVTLGKKQPSYGVPTASSITYGDSLLTSELVGGITTTPGHFEWVNGNTLPNVNNVDLEYEVKFIPDDEIYKTVTIKIPVHVEPKVLEVEWKNTELTYNGESQQPTVEIISGLVGNDSPTIVVNGSNVNAGEYIAQASCTSDNYKLKALDQVRPYVINKKDVEVTPNISGVHYDDIVSNDPSKVNSTVDLTFGSVEFEVDTSYHETGNDPKRDVTIKSITITKDGEDVTSNYYVIKNTQKITLEKIPVTLVTEPTATAITYGDTLGDSTVTGEMSCEGTFSFRNESVVPHVKDDSSLEEYEVVFIPTNSEKYEIPTDTMKTSIKVEPKVLEVEWKNTELTYNGESQQPKVEIISGLLGTDSPTIVVNGSNVNAGEYIAQATCTSDDYKLKALDQVHPYLINKKDVTIKAINQSVDYGESISSTISDISLITPLATGDSISNVSLYADTNTFVANNETDIIVQSVIIKKGENNVTDNYNVTKEKGIVTLGKKRPNYEIPTASSITYGDSLSTSELVGGITTTPGHFEWVNGNVLPIVSNPDLEYEVKFIPDDDTYRPVIIKVPVHVEPKVLEVEWKNTELTYNGESQQPTVEIISGLVGTDSPTIVVNGSNVNAGEYIAQASCTSDNYKLKALDQTHGYIINKKDITIKAIDQSVDYGDTISSTVNDIVLKTSLITGDVLKEVTLTADTYTLSPNNEADIIIESVVIKKSDTDVSRNYNITKEKGIVSLGKRIPSYEIPTASSITYGDSLSTSELVGGITTTPGHFEWVNSNTLPKVNATDLEYDVKFVPDDDTYKSVVIKVPVHVEPKVLEVEWKNTELTYNGESQQPSVEIISGLVGTDSPTITVNGSNTYVGEYIAQATCASDDYKLKALDQTHAYIINKKDITIKAKNQSVDYGKNISSTVNDVTLTTPLATGDVISKVILNADTNSLSANNEADITIESVVINKGEIDVTENYSIIKGKGIVSLGKRLPNYEVPTATVITYGDLLSTSELTGGITTVPGHFEWVNGNILPKVNNTDLEYEVKFIPDDLVSYDIDTLYVPVHVNPKELDIEWEKTTFEYDGKEHIPVVSIVSGIVNNDKVDYELCDRKKYVGLTTCSITLKNDNYTVKQEDVSSNFAIIPKQISITVRDQSIKFGEKISSLPNDVIIPEGSLNESEYLDSITIYEVSAKSSGSSNIPITAKDILLKNQNGEDVSKQYYITIKRGLLSYNKLTPVLVTDPDITPIIYGDNLTNDLINNGEFDVPGHFEWKEVYTPSVNDSNLTEYIVKFIPDDDYHYSVVELPVKVTVNPREVELEWFNTEFIYNGKEQVPNAKIKGDIVPNDIIDVIVSGGEINASFKPYTASGSISNNNYILKPESTKCNFYIKSADISKLDSKSVDVYFDDKGKLITELIDDNGYLVEGNNEDYIVSTINYDEFKTVVIKGVNNYDGSISKLIKNPLWSSKIKGIIELDEATKKLNPNIKQIADDDMYSVINNAINYSINNTNDLNLINKLNTALEILNETKNNNMSTKGYLKSKVTLILSNIDKITDVSKTNINKVLNDNGIFDAEVISSTDIKLMCKYTIYDNDGDILFTRESEINDISKEALGDDAFEVEIELTIPQDKYTNVDNRNFYLVHEHKTSSNTETELLNFDSDSNVIKFKTNKFSTYTLLYKDKKKKNNNNENPRTGDSIVVYIILLIVSFVNLIMYIAFKTKKSNRNH